MNGRLRRRTASVLPRLSRWFYGGVLAKLAVAIIGLMCLALFVGGAHRYSTSLERIASHELVSEWEGKAQFRVGDRPWVEIEPPKTNLRQHLQEATTGEQAFYKFPVQVSRELRASGVEVSFSPNWIVHPTYEIFVNGRWVASGHGVDAVGDIVYQKVVVPLRRDDVQRDQTEILIVADIGTQDLGIQHHGKILVGPTTILKGLHLEAEHAMGSYYLLFLVSEIAIFAMFAVIFLTTRTGEGFGYFVMYCFFIAATHLFVGNFLDGTMPLNLRVWFYFLSKAFATACLGSFFCAYAKFGKVWLVWSVRIAPVAAALILLCSYVLEVPQVTIALQHQVTNSLFLALILGSFFSACGQLLRGKAVYLGATVYLSAYSVFLCWNFFFHGALDFDYRPLADLVFLFYIGFLTITEFGFTQTKAMTIEGNFRRLQRNFSRLVGKELGQHLVVSGQIDDGATRDVTLTIIDYRQLHRAMMRFGTTSAFQSLETFIVAACEAIEGRGGEVNKINGGTILGVWGLTKPNTLGAMSACLAALDLREKLENHNVDPRNTMPISMGGCIATGEVFCGGVGRGRSDYSVFGPLVASAYANVEVAKHLGLDFVMDETTWSQVRDNAIVEVAQESDTSGDQGQSFALIGLQVKGVGGPQNRIISRCWASRFEEQTPGVVHGAGANQLGFVPNFNERGVGKIA